MRPDDFTDEAGAPNRGLSIENVHEKRRVDREQLEELIGHVVHEEEAEIHYLGVVLAGHETVLNLNRSYLEHDYVTDVLSFPLREAGDSEPVVVDGEVYVDLDTAAERAPEFDTTVEEEIYRYVVHGLLHLIGYDDQTEDERQKMKEREDRYLAELV